MIKNIFTDLVEEGRLEEKHLSEAVRLVDETGESLDSILRSKGYLSEDILLEFLAEKLDMELIGDLSEVDASESFIQKVPLAFARSFSIIGLGEENGRIKVATSSPLDMHVLDQAESMLEKEIEAVISPRAEITSLVSRAYTGDTEDVGDMLDDLDAESILGDIKDMDVSEDVLDIANKPPIIKLVNSVLFETLKMRASDVHFQPYEDKLKVRHRIDGILYDFKTIPKKAQEAVISRIKVMGKMDIAERRILDR